MQLSYADCKLIGKLDRPFITIYTILVTRRRISFISSVIRALERHEKFSVDNGGV